MEGVAALPFTIRMFGSVSLWGSQIFSTTSRSVSREEWFTLFRTSRTVRAQRFPAMVSFRVLVSTT